MVNQVEWTRKQLEELCAMLKARKAEPAEVEEVDALERDAPPDEEEDESDGDWSE